MVRRYTVEQKYYLRKTKAARLCWGCRGIAIWPFYKFERIAEQGIAVQLIITKVKRRTT